MLLLEKNGQIGGCPPPRSKRGGAQLLFLFREHGLARGQGLQHDVAHVQAGAVGAFHDVVGRGHGAGDNVDLGLQPDAAHAHGVLDAGLVVHDVFLGQNVNDLPVHGNGHGPGRLLDPLHVLGRDLRPLDGDHPPGC